MTLAQQVHDALRKYPDGAILSASDRDDYPVSLRCRPTVDGDTLVVERPKWCDAVDGPAALSGHRHNEQGGKLRAVLSRGTLENRDGVLVFTPTTLDNTVGGSIGDTLGTVRRGHRNAIAYLKRRAMARPDVPWHVIEAARRKATSLSGPRSGHGE